LAVSTPAVETVAIAGAATTNPHCGRTDVGAVAVGS